MPEEKLNPLTTEQLKETLGEENFEKIHTSLLYDNPVNYAEKTLEVMEEGTDSEFVKWLLQVPELEGSDFKKYTDRIIDSFTEEYGINLREYKKVLDIITGIANSLRYGCRNKVFEMHRTDLLLKHKFSNVSG